MRSKILMGIAVVAVVIGAGVCLGLLAGRGTSTVPTVAEQNPTPVNTTPAPPPPVTETQAILPAPVPLIEVTQSLAMPQNSNVAPAPTNSVSTNKDWEDQIDDIVGSDDPDTNKVKRLFALFPNLPPEGQEDAVQHLSNLVDDENYAPLGELLKDDKLPDGVLDGLLSDVLNRPNNLKLPLLLDVASDPNHAKRDEAKDLLELYLGEDYGQDWNKWGTQMTNWLQQNPD
jgi:hypothetical protein